MAALVPPPEESARPGALTASGRAEETEDFVWSSFCSELSRRQNEQRQRGMFCDVTLVFNRGVTAGGADAFELSAHGSVLAAATDYFGPLLGGQFSESLSRRVEMKEWNSETGPTPETVESVIQYMYTGQIRVSTCNVQQVLELADRFLLQRLKDFCGQFLRKKLSIPNCVVVHSLAHMYTLDPLALCAASMIRCNFSKVIQDEGFYALPFSLVRKWLSDTEITVDSEEELFEAVVKWVRRNPEERSHCFEELFRLLNLSQIRPSYLVGVVKNEHLVAVKESCLGLVSETLEGHAFRFENFRSGNPDSSSHMASGPRSGQKMDVIMVVGGVSDGGDYLSECVGYFIDEDRWVNLPHLHNHLDSHAIAATESHIYVAGSMEPDFAKTVERYSPSLNTWEQVSSLDMCKHSFGLARIKDTLYSIGGRGNFSPGFRDVGVYEPEQDKWHKAESAPRILRDVKTVSVEDRYVYVTARAPMETNNEDGVRTVTACFDTESRQWRDVVSLPLLDNYCIFQVAVASTNFYHTASCCPKNYAAWDDEARDKTAALTSQEILDSLPPEVTGIEGAAICPLGEDVFIMGGWMNSDDVDKQYRREAFRYCSKQRRWTLLPPMPQPRCRAAACHARIPYRFLRGSQRHPMPHNLAHPQGHIQKTQCLNQQTLNLRRQGG